MRFGTQGMAFEVTLLTQAEYDELLTEALITGEVLKRDGMATEKD